MQTDIEKLKKALKTKCITYTELSMLSGIPLNTIKKIFSGITPNPRIDTIKALEKVLLESEKPTLAQQVLDTTLANLDIDDFNNLTPTEQQQVIAVFNSVVSTFKNR